MSNSAETTKKVAWGERFKNIMLGTAVVLGATAVGTVVVFDAL